MSSLHALPCGLHLPFLHYPSLRGPNVLLDSPIPSIPCAMLRVVPRGTILNAGADPLFGSW
jgi:hypothetical protein